VPYVIAEACIDVMDRSCMDECPVDCIYEGASKLYVNPKECIDCGACEPVCPVEAITQDRHVPDEETAHVQDNVDFFAETLPGRDGPLGTPGGAHKTGVIGVDTAFVRDRS